MSNSSKIVKHTIPTRWEEIKLSLYLKYYDAIKDKKPEDEGYNEFVIREFSHYICLIHRDLFPSLEMNTINEIGDNMTKMFKQTSAMPLVQTFKIDETEYGFHPNLQDLTYGEYLDLTLYGQKLWEQDNIYKFLSILYRPIIRKNGKEYILDEYSGTSQVRIDIFKSHMTCNVVWGAISFFLLLQLALVNSTNLYLTELTQEVAQELKRTLLTNGEHIKQSIAWLADDL
jgi:hypothetical protein